MVGVPLTRDKQADRYTQTQRNRDTVAESLSGSERN